MMIQKLGMIIFFRDQMMILSCRSSSFWNSRKPCPSLICYYMKDEVPKEKGKSNLKIIYIFSHDLLSWIYDTTLESFELRSMVSNYA